MSDPIPDGDVREVDGGDVQAAIDDSASSVWSRIFYPRDWLGLIREHVGGIAQVALAVFIPAYVASFALQKVLDRAMESDEDRTSIVDRLTTIDDWVDRVRGIALLVFVVAVVLFIGVWLLDRSRRSKV